MMRLSSFVCVAALATSFLSASAANGAPFSSRAAHVVSPGRSAASEDSGEALVLNPANVANVPGAEARVTAAACSSTSYVGCGYAATFALPVWAGLSTGLRFDYVTPPARAGAPFFGRDYAWLTWGLGYLVSERLQVGATLARSQSPNAFVDGLVSLGAGVTYRPSPHLGFALVAHDLNAPRAAATLPGIDVLPRSFVPSLVVRPTGKRILELGLEARYFDEHNIRPRATLGFDIPGFGRIRGDLEAQNIGDDARRGIVATAGAELQFAHLGLGGGALFGSGLGEPSSVGEYVTAAISSYRSPGIPRAPRAVYMRLESTPGTRGHVALLRNLWKLAEDKEIAAVTMVLRAEPAASLAHAEELADAFRLLRAHGKKVVCSFEDAGAKALYACASADRVVVNPAGGIRYSGLRTTHVYLAGLLKKLGVKAEFVRIGAHKSAPEQFMNEHASDVARADQEDLLAQNEAVFARNMALYRHIPEDQFRAMSAKGPFVAEEAREAKLVDGFAFDDELERVTRDVVGRRVAYSKFVPEAVAPDAFGPRGRIGLLYIDGDIIDGRSRNIPLLGQKLVGSYTIADTIEQLRADTSVKAVVLRIESPGGSSMASDVMWRELRKLAEKKPLIVSMGSIAASGGYYVAAAAHRIYALPLTITGSIGIFYGKADVSELLGKLGVNVEVRKTVPRADAESLFRGFTDDERVELERKIGQFYGVFLDRVALGRHMTTAEVDAVGQGRVWAGQQALAHHLVDKLGGLRDALEAAREAAHLPDDAPIVEVPAVERSLLDVALGLAGLKTGAGVVVDALPVSVREVLRAVAPMSAFGDAQALARMEWVPLEDTPGVDDDAVGP